ncbi:hypothetical protein D3C79_1029490 [compost metagenome]
MSPTPVKSARSVMPFSPLVIFPPNHAKIKPITIAIAEACTRPLVKYLDNLVDNHIIKAIKAKAVIKPKWVKSFNNNSTMNFASNAV